MGESLMDGSLIAMKTMLFLHLQQLAILQLPALQFYPLNDKPPWKDIFLSSIAMIEFKEEFLGDADEAPLLPAMKVENMMKLKEEFDYKGLCRRLEIQLEKLIAEHERQTKVLLSAEEEQERKVREAQSRGAKAESKLASALEFYAGRQPC
eukprot:Gb_23030 [translate_table: standard]